MTRAARQRQRELSTTSRSGVISVSTDYDAVVVGASIAGCTAATLLARAGARVALVERHTDPAAYKKTCTHFFQGSATATLNRLGLMPALAAAGAVPNKASVWTRFGWIVPHPGPDYRHPAHGYNLRRETFDPMLRATAASTPGVELLLGHTVKELIRDGDRVAGVITQDRGQVQHRLRARLTVAADGRDSKVAALVGSAGTPAANNRFIYWAYYRGLQEGYGTDSRAWFLDPDAAYVFPNEDDLTLVVAMPTKTWLPEFKRDVNDAYTRYVAALPDGGPPIADAERVSPIIGKLDVTNRSRPAARPGLAFVGDAALTSDPLWGVGCGWALQSAEWLADSVGDALANEGDVDAELTRYRRLHRRRLAAHQWMICDYASGRKFNVAEKAIFSTAVEDPEMALAMHTYVSRAVPLYQVMSPRLFGRAVAKAIRSRRATAPARNPATPLSS
jgi:flavin-dependent dehydrogenase